jgi:hypothetical protein
LKGLKKSNESRWNFLMGRGFLWSLGGEREQKQAKKEPTKLSKADGYQQVRHQWATTPRLAQETREKEVREAPNKVHFIIGIEKDVPMICSPSR